MQRKEENRQIEVPQGYDDCQLREVSNVCHYDFGGLEKAGQDIWKGFDDLVALLTRQTKLQKQTLESWWI